MVARVTRVLPPNDALVRNAGVAATELIREAIIEGRLEPGRRLKEEELARELGISRTPVREALLMLQAEDLVVATPNRGATVRVHDANDLHDLYELRALLEGLALAYARVDRALIVRQDIRAIAVLDQAAAIAADLHQRRRILVRLEPDDDLRGVVRENLFFHNTILAVAASERLTALVRKVIELPLVYNSYRWYSPEQMRISAHYHRQIVKALADGDADRAELIMKEHLFEARDLLVAHVQAIQQSTSGKPE